MKKQMQPTNHMAYIDAAKAIGIILVVFGHTYGIPIQLYKIVYSFHMPLFFLIAGYLYNTEKYNRMSFKKIAIKKAKAYVVPYIGFALANLGLQMLWHPVFKREFVDVKYIVHNLAGIAYGYADKAHMPNCSPLWFLVCLFWASLLFWAIMKYAPRWAWLLTTMCVVMSYTLYLFVDVRLPWNIPTALMGVFFLYLGYSMRKTACVDKVLQCKGNSAILIALLIISCVVALVNRANVGMNENTYGYLSSFLVAAVLLSFVVIAICKKFSFMQNQFLVWLGRNTIFVMAFNYFLRDLTTEMYYLVPGIRNYPIHWSVSFVLTMAGCLIGSWLYEKMKAVQKKTVTSEVST